MVDFEFLTRLGSDWTDLAAVVGVEAVQRARFTRGEEPRELWDWLANRRRLHQLPSFLTQIGRRDLVDSVRRTVLDGTGGPSVERRYGRTRPALDGARILPLQERDILAREFIPAMNRVAEHGGIVTVVGDAGMGKSVLLGQLYDNAADRTDGGVMLLSCATLTGQRPDDVTELDAAAGRLTCGSSSLIQALAVQRRQYGRTLLFVDTLDLLLDPSSVPVLAEFLHGVTEAGAAVVLTCRLFEYETFLEPVHAKAPLLSDRVDAHRLKPLHSDEVRRFALEFLRADPTVLDPQAFVERLLHLRDRRRAVLEMCGNPLLLSLVCTLFAPDGEVPQDLTVSRLYRAYWERKISVDADRPAVGPLTSALREQIVLAAGRYLISESTTTFVEEFGAADVTGEPPRAGALAVLEGLRSSGVIVTGSGDGRLAFFHQTCAEFVMAQHLLREATARAAFVSALRRAGAGSHLWPVMIQLLYAAGRERGDAEFRALLDQLDLDLLHAWRAVLVATITRADAPTLQRLAETSPERGVEHQRVLVDALGSVDDTLLLAALDVLAGLLTGGDLDILQLASTVAGGLLPRVPASARAPILERLLKAAAAAESRIDDDRQAQHVSRHVLAGLSAADLNTAQLGVLYDAYGTAGPLRRVEIIRLVAPNGPVECARLLKIAFVRALPVPARELLIGMTVTVVTNPEARHLLAWSGWYDMMITRYFRQWDDIQIAAVVTLVGTAGDDPAVAPSVADLVRLSWDPDSHIRQRAIHACGTLAERQPVAVAHALTDLPKPDDRARVQAARAHAKRMGVLPEPDARSLTCWLLDALDDHDALPVEEVLQGAAHAAKSHVLLLHRVLDRIALVRPGKQGERVITAIVDGCPVKELPLLRRGLLAALPADGSIGLRARICGLLVPIDEESRIEATRFMLGPEPVHARAAARRMVEAARAWNWYDGAFLAPLLDAPTPGVVESVLELLADARHRGHRLDTTIAAAVLAALRTVTAAPVCGMLVDALRHNPAEGEPDLRLLEQAVSILRNRVRQDAGHRALQDLTAVLVRGILALLGDALYGTRPPAWFDQARTLLRELPLDEVRRTEEDVRNLAVVLDKTYPGALERLLDDIALLPVNAQVGLAMAAEHKFRPSGAAFRSLGARDDVAAAVRTYVVARLS